MNRLEEFIDELDDTMSDVEFQNYSKRIAQKKRKTQFIIFLLAGVLIISMLAIIVYQRDKIVDVTDSPLVLEEVTPQIIMKVLASATNGIEELNTYEYTFVNSAHYSDSRELFKKWKIPFTEKSFTLQWSGVIKTGIDLSKLKTNIKGDVITITIPAAEIFSYDVDEENVKLLDEKNNILNPISVDDKLKLDSATEKEMKQKAIENGILEKAQENAKSIILKLLLADTKIGRDYTIEFILE